MPRTSGRDGPARAVASFGIASKTHPWAGFRHSRRGSRGMGDLVEGDEREDVGDSTGGPDRTLETDGEGFSGDASGTGELNHPLAPSAAWQELRKKKKRLSTQNTTAPPPRAEGAGPFRIYRVTTPSLTVSCRPSSERSSKALETSLKSPIATDYAVPQQSERPSVYPLFRIPCR